MFLIKSLIYKWIIIFGAVRLARYLSRRFADPSS